MAPTSRIRARTHPSLRRRLGAEDDGGGAEPYEGAGTGTGVGGQDGTGGSVPRRGGGPGKPGGVGVGGGGPCPDHPLLGPRGMSGRPGGGG